MTPFLPRSIWTRTISVKPAPIEGMMMALAAMRFRALAGGNIQGGRRRTATGHWSSASSRCGYALTGTLMAIVRWFARLEARARRSQDAKQGDLRIVGVHRMKIVDAADELSARADIMRPAKHERVLAAAAERARIRLRLSPEGIELIR